MRAKNLNRLNSASVDINDINYLHYYSYHEDLFGAFEKYAHGKLLDIGCGNKPYEKQLKGKITSYTGVDIIQSSDNKVDYLCQANAIPFQNSLYDIVISTQTIEHVEDHQGLVNEAFRLLKPNGIFILSGPLYWPLHEEPYDFFRFTKYGFQYILQKAGFEVLEIKSNGGKWALVGQAILYAIYPDIYHIKGIKGKIARTMLRLIGGIKTINRLFLKLDIKSKDYSNTMNYVIVSKK
ncbi:class I SAM-dependent methyltransferase [Pedobacter riviphilus]|uniref:Class I SAM-dependent methyltransferase n=1 Tax=Pedobacter riviphilus TaxID=2766984 RepID=A0ABX6TIG6_9SPHI|nr:class I SAM-dependent methyltransferase [Pedobacter riviphilus]QNR85309.1 class I SAM-dependent methyltransferase [Pedobacter riviphilus]